MALAPTAINPGGGGTAAACWRSTSVWSHLMEEQTVLGTVLLVVLILLLVGALPTWPHSAGWGYYPSSGLGLLLIIIVVLLVSGRI
jgi:hypothetical protein